MSEEPATPRRPGSGHPDHALLDPSQAPLGHQGATGLDAAYAAYEAHPLDEADEWGDLASFRAAAGGS